MQCQKMLRILWICAIILPALLSRNCLLKKQGHKSWNSAWPKHCQRKKNSRNWRNSRCLHCKMSLKFYSTVNMTVTASTAKKVLAQKSWNVSHYIGWPTNFLYLHFMVPIKLASPPMHIAFCWKKFLIGLVVFYTMVHPTLKWVLCR